MKDLNGYGIGACESKLGSDAATKEAEAAAKIPFLAGTRIDGALVAITLLHMVRVEK